MKYTIMLAPPVLTDPEPFDILAYDQRGIDERIRLNLHQYPAAADIPREPVHEVRIPFPIDKDRLIEIVPLRISHDENIDAHLKGRPLAGSYDWYSSCPIVTSSHDMLLAEFDYDLNLKPSFPLLDPTKPHRAYWYLKKYGLPFLYWNLMLKGLA